MKISRLELSAYILLTVSLAGIIFVAVHSTLILTSTGSFEDMIKAIYLHMALFMILATLLLTSLALYGLAMAKHNVE